MSWQHKSRHCIHCGKVGPRVQVAGGWAHRRCIQKPIKPRHDLAAQVKALGADSLLPDWKP